MTVVVIVGIILLFWLSYLVYEIISKEIRWQRAKAIIEEEKAAIERAKENEKKFYEVMAALGFQNPVADFLRLTKENRVHWEKISDKWYDYVFRAENVIDGIGLECTEGWEIETVPGPAFLCREIIFLDKKNRFANRYFISITVGGKTREKDSEEKLVDEYVEWLKNKFENKKPE
jgi:hypothetical protein